MAKAQKGVAPHHAMVVSSRSEDFVRFDGVFVDSGENAVTQFVKSESEALVKLRGNGKTDIIFFFRKNLKGIKELNRLVRKDRSNLLISVIIIYDEKDLPLKDLPLLGTHSGLTEFIHKDSLNVERLKQIFAKSKNRGIIFEAVRGEITKKKDYLSILAHDLRSPLSIIKSYSDILLEEKQSPEERKREILRIKSNAETALGLIQNLLEEARGRLPLKLNFKVISLNSVIKAVIDNFDLKIREKEIQVHFTPKEDFNVYGDYRSLIQLFSNLMSNAIKFGRFGGSIRILVEERKGLGTEATHEWVYIGIVDDGPGIPDEKLTEIFDRFSQARETDTLYGTGLGLSICKRVCQIHMGRIWATNNQSAGATFHLLLRQTSRYQINPKNISKFRVLVVDDVPDVRTLTQKALRKMGMTVQLASNGQSAIQAIKESPPDLILLDLLLEDMDGLAVLRSIKGTPDLENIPIFIYSVFHSSPIFMQAVELANGFLQKPLDEKEFRAKIGIYVDQKTVSHSRPNKKKPIVKSGKDHTKLKVLLVDDSQDNHDIMSYFFDMTPHNVESAYRGEECLEKIENGNYDLVLMDLSMPGMDGYETIQAIRNLESGGFRKERIPVIAFSAEDALKEIEKTKDFGFDSYLTKPVSPKKLKDALSPYLAKRS